MQCQSCGVEVKKHLKTCPSCGENITASPTSIIASQGTTTSLEPSFINQLSSVTSSASGNIKLNDKASNGLLSTLLASNMLTEKGAFTKETTPPTEVLTKEMLCRRCHNELKPGAKFCSVCGTTSGPSKIELLASSLQTVAKEGVKKARIHLAQTSLPILTIGCLLLGSFAMLGAIFQYLIPTSVDDNSLSPLIYHLRGIQFLLMALIFVVTGLIFNRR
ncbi:MAG: zinc ribbon domain-containing protein [Acidobacteria bacterium]|nr:zinc ribbon domain-containing protein [Acidobacteriota bacterium]